MNIKYFSLLFSTGGIALLYFLSTLFQPSLIDLQSIAAYEGKQVIVEGIVTEHHTTSYGSQIITIEDNNAEITVFVEEPIDVEYGDRIQAIGTVQKYNEDWEIVVDNQRFVTILQKWQNSTMPLWQIAETPTKYDGVNVNVTGYIDMIYDRSFYLVDSEDEHSILVFYLSSDNPVFYPGQKVSVAARFMYDEETYRYVLEVSEETHNILVLTGG